MPSLYESVAARLREEIARGVYAKGDRLPAENELAEVMGVSRPTVRQALDLLAREGRVSRIKGSGTYVTEPKLVHESTSFITSYREESREKNLTVRTRVIAQEVERASDAVARALSIHPGEKVTRLSRIRHLENVYHDLPVLRTTVYVPLKLFPDMPELDFTDASLYAFFAERRLTVVRASKHLEVVIPSEEIAAELKISVFEPTVFIASTGYREDGAAVEYSESWYPASRSGFRIELNT